MYYRHIRQLALNVCLNNPCLCEKIASLATIVTSLMTHISKYTRGGKNKAFIVLFLLVITAVPVIDKYGGLRFEQILFILALPFTLRRHSKVYQRLTMIGAFVFLLLYYVLHIYSMFYIGLGMTVMLCLMAIPYRPTLLSYMLIAVTTPALQYLFQVFSFAIRLHLTQVAGNVLEVFYPTIEVAGNCLVLNGINFTIAPECLGLNMLSSTLVVAVFSLAFWSKRSKAQGGVFVIIAFATVAFALVAAGNVVRIILTVMLSAMPDTALHEFIGLVVFLIYICLPLLLLGAFARRFFNTITNTHSKAIRLPLIVASLFVLLIAGAYFVDRNQVQEAQEPLDLGIDGMQQSCSTDGVVKMSNDKVLIYIKPPAFFLGSDHHPFICWRASGYHIKNENIITIGGHDVYTFQIEKDGEEPMYSCWWYSNGQKHTCSQMQWRLAAIKGEGAYSVVNVSSLNKDECLRQVLMLVNN